MSTIPANLFVSASSSVISAGGSQLQMNGLMLTESTRVPIGTVQSFSTKTAVASYFGASSDEAKYAAIYFAGFEGADKLPGALLLAQYPVTAVAAYLRGGTLGLTLAQLKALSGSLTIEVDGASFTAASIALSAATSFSNAASLIQAALDTTLATEASFTGAISGTTLTVSSVASGSIEVGQTIAGPGVAAGTKITAEGTGTGGTGTYTVSASQTVASESMTATVSALSVSYDSVSGAFIITSGTTGPESTIGFATGTLAGVLSLTSAAGSVISQGAAAATDPGAFMDGLIELNQNWFAFMTIFDPDNGAGFTEKEAFSAWTNAQDNRFAYACWDTDESPRTMSSATDCLGYAVTQANYSGTALVSTLTDASFAAFVLAFPASLDFGKTNGRATLAYKSQTGLVADVTTSLAATNLGGNPQSQGDFGNGYNYYGAIGTGFSTFVNFQRGFVSGPFQWFDSYVNQAWITTSLQSAILAFFAAVKSDPYNRAGYDLIEEVLSGIMDQAVNFGAARRGVTLSAAQIAEVNNQAGVAIDATLSAQGYYIQIQDASATVRASRGSPPVNVWYMDGESIQALTIGSYLVQ